MEATIDWCYQLLAPEERLLFERLSVFAGGFEIDAAQRCAPTRNCRPLSVPDIVGGPRREVAVLKRVQRAGRERFRVLEILRQFGAERLAGESEMLLRRRHLAWIADLAAIAGAHDRP